MLEKELKLFNKISEKISRSLRATFKLSLDVALELSSFTIRCEKYARFARIGACTH